MISQSYLRHLNLVATLEGLIDSRGLSLEDVVMDLGERYAEHEDFDPPADGEEDFFGHFESFEDLPTDLLDDYVQELLNEEA